MMINSIWHFMIQGPIQQYVHWWASKSYFKSSITNSVSFNALRILVYHVVHVLDTCYFIRKRHFLLWSFFNNIGSCHNTFCFIVSLLNFYRNLSKNTFTWFEDISSVIDTSVSTTLVTLDISKTRYSNSNLSQLWSTSTLGSLRQL
jgi:hypothetical protein